MWRRSMKIPTLWLTPQYEVSTHPIIFALFALLQHVSFKHSHYRVPQRTGTNQILGGKPNFVSPNVVSPNRRGMIRQKNMRLTK